MKFQRLVQMAQSLKTHDLNQKYKHFSFILRRNKVISVGWNKMTKTHPMAARYNFEYPFSHSELDSLRKFPYKMEDLRKCTMVNIRLGSSSKIFLSRPCKVCANMLKLFGVGQVFYSNGLGFFEEMIVR